LIGSFLNVIIFRLPQMLSDPRNTTSFNLAWPRSHCPHCQQTLRWVELIPIISFCLQRARCRYCQAPIAWRYPLVECTYTLLIILTYLQFGLSTLSFMLVLFHALMLSLWVIDYQHQLLPDSLTLIGLWLGLICSVLGGPITPSESILAAAGSYLLLRAVADGYRWCRKQEGMGGGDMKLLAMLGAWFGTSVLFILILSVTIALLVTLIRYGSGRLSWQQPVAFGPFLILGGWVWLFAQTWLAPLTQHFLSIVALT